MELAFAKHNATHDLQVDIVDVGHGSCVAIRSGTRLSLIDTGPGGPILEYLRTERIERIETVVISHADADHIGGLVAILGEQIPVERVVWNGDAAKTSGLWRDLVYELDALDSNGSTLASEEVRAGASIVLAGMDVELSILAPRLQLRRQGAGAVDRDGHRITSNSMSAVVRVMVDGEPLLLVPGDLDATGFKHLMNDPRADVTARYLLLPHHGGQLGTKQKTVAMVKELTTAVAPEAVFVSNGRGRFGNPRRDVLEAARAVIKDLPIMCTQLAEACAPMPVSGFQVAGPYAVGRARGFSCAATTRLGRLSGIDAPLDRRDHEDFVASRVPAAMCALPTDTGDLAEPNVPMEPGVSSAGS